MSQIIFTSDLPQVYTLDQIYDSRTNPTGAIIPRPNSLVIDPNNNGLLQRVLSVNSTTFNSTYGPVFTSLLAPAVDDLDPDDNHVVSIIDYGNSRFYLFYDTGEKPTKLTIDKKVVVLGDDAVSFEIAKYDAGLQQYTPISLYYDSTGIFKGTKIPLVNVEGRNDVKIPTNCHTTKPINENDVLHMFIYDYAGTQCGALKLYAKRALINNTLEDELIIQDFIIEATQMDEEGVYLFPDQDPGSLVITPRIVFNNGSTRMINIDNEVCHLYGLEGFTAAYPGQSVNLLIKYFLAPTQQATGKSLVISGNSRYLIKQVKLTVKNPGTNEYTMKILTVPRYLPTQSKWTLGFFLYVHGESLVRNITPLVTVQGNFDGRLMGVEQELVLVLRIRDIFPGAISDFMYQQPVVIKLAPYDYYERYVIRDSVGDTYGVYGVDSPILPRPVIYYNPNTEKYRIPTSKFANKTSMLESFYYRSRPIYDTSWLNAPVTPSHFTIRNAVNGTLIVSSPISIENYHQDFGLVNVIDQNVLVGVNCIVEFLKYENGQYTVLWGSVVDVYSVV